MAVFQLQSNQAEGQVVPLRDRPITIGRHPDNDIVLQDDLASRFHCVIEPSPAGFRVRDLGSRNGTRLNDQKISTEMLDDLFATSGIRLTPLAFILRACALTLAEFPHFGSSLAPDGRSLIVKRYTHLGFAVDTDDGLVVPVIRDADKKDVFEIAGALSDLSARARAGKLKVDDMQGGVFTVSSLGGIGGTFFTPIINAPEVAILGVSRNQWRPVLEDGEFVPRLMMPLSLSYDHRVIDGADAVRFTTHLAKVLGQVERLVEAIP